LRLKWIRNREVTAMVQVIHPSSLNYSTSSHNVHNVHTMICGRKFSAGELGSWPGSDNPLGHHDGEYQYHGHRQLEEIKCTQEDHPR
jgi:hypothetical protein